MNRKIENYVDVLFMDVPRNKQSIELKEELMSNMSDRFDDYIQEGKSENQAYSLVISNLGDIDEMLADVMPTEAFVEQSDYYTKRNARNVAIAVVMYIVGAAFLIGLGGYGETMGNSDAYAITGLIILLVISAVATGIIIYSFMSTPSQYKKITVDRNQSLPNLSDKNNRLLKNILSTYWIMITFIYLTVSFLTKRWDITWIIWILAAVLESIIKIIYEMKYTNEGQ